MSDTTQVVGEAFVRIRPLFDRFTTEMDATLAGIVGSANIAGTAVGLAFGAGLVAVGTSATKMANEFNSAMERIHTQAGSTQKAVDQFKGAVLNLSGEVGWAPTKLAEALYHVQSAFESTGITGEKAMSILRVAAKGATIGHANLVDVTNGLDAAIVAGIPGVENFDQAMGALNATVGAGDMTMQNLADALGTGVLAVVKGYGLSLRDAGAALAVFGDNNIRGAQAGTALRMAVQSLAVPLSSSGGLLAKVGLTTHTLAEDMQHGGLNQALTDLNQHMIAAGITGNKTGEFLTQAFGKRAGIGLAVLMNQFDRFQSKLVAVDEGATGFGEAWRATSELTTQRIAQVKAMFDALLIRIGTPLSAALGKAIGLFLKFTQYLSAHQQVLHSVEIAVVALLGKALAPLLPILARLVTVVLGASAPFLAMGVAVAIAARALTNAYQTSQAFRDVVNSVAADVETAWKAIQKVFGDALGAIGAAFAKYHDVVVVAAEVVAAIGAIGVAFHAGAAIAGVLTTALGALGVVLSPVGLIVAGIAAVAAGAYYAYQQFDGFRQIVDSAAIAIVAFAQNALAKVQTLTSKGGALRNTYREVANAVTGAFSAIQTAVTNATPSIFGVAISIGEFFKSVALGAAGLGTTVGGFLASIGESAASTLGSLLGRLPDVSSKVATVLGSVAGDIAKFATGNFTVALDIADQLGVGPEGQGKVIAATSKILEIRSGFFAALHGHFDIAAVDVADAVGVGIKGQHSVLDGVRTIERGLSEYFSMIGNLATGDIKGAAKNITDLLGLNKTQGDAVARGAAAVQVHVDDFIGHTKRAFDSLKSGDASGVAGNIAEALGFGDKSAIAVETSVNNFGEHAKRAISSAMSGSLTGVTGNIAEALGFSDKTATSVQLATRGIVNGAKDIGSAFSTALSGKDVKTKNPVIQLVEGIGDAIRFLGTTVLPAIGEVVKFIGSKLESLGAYFEHVAPLAAKAFGQIADIIKSAMTFISIVIEIALAAIRVAWDTFGPAILQTVQIAWDLIKSIISAAMLIIEGVITTVLAIIAGDWGAAWEGIRNIVAGVWDAVYAVVKAAIELVWTVIQVTMATILLGVSGVWNAISDATGAVWHGIVDVITSVLGAIWGAITGTLNAIGSFFSSIWNAVGGVVSTVFAGIWTVISTGLNVWWGIIQSVLGSIAGFFSRTWDSVASAVSGAFNTVVSKVTGGVSSVITEVGKLPGQIKDVFKDAGTWLLQAGQDIIQGLVNGLNKLKDVPGKVVGGIGSGIKDVFSKAVHLGSPSRDFHQFGLWIGQGLLNGIIEMQSAVNKATAGLVEAPSKLTAMNIGAAGAGSTSSSSVTKNNYNLTLLGNYKTQADPAQLFARMQRLNPLKAVS